MKHFLIRHPAVSTSGRCIGQTDVPLSDAGRESLPELIQQVRSRKPEILISSDLHRCSDLAVAAGQELACPVHLDSHWREICFGDWENRSWDEIRKNDEPQFERWANDYQNQTPPQGEGFHDFLSRVRAALNELPTDQTAVVVTHAGCIRAVACLLKSVSPETMFDLEVPYGSIFELDLEQLTLITKPPHGHSPSPSLTSSSLVMPGVTPALDLLNAPISGSMQQIERSS